MTTPTPWYDTSVAAAIVATIAALGGAWLGAWRTGKTASDTAEQDRQHAASEARLEREHAAEQARLDRLYQHRVETFGALLETLGPLMHAALDDPDASLEAELRRSYQIAHARASLFASQEVQKVLQEINTAVSWRDWATHEKRREAASTIANASFLLRRLMRQDLGV